MNNKFLSVVFVFAFLGLSGCATRTRTVDIPDTTSQASVVKVVQGPGVVQEIWEEPMVDVVDVPPGLDPDGHYYRPGHQAVVEIRQGRWKYHEQDQ